MNLETHTTLHEIVELGDIQIENNEIIKYQENHVNIKNIINELKIECEILQ